MKLSQNDKNWQLKASCKKQQTVARKQNFKLYDKNLQYLHMLMQRREVMQNLS